MEEIKVDLLVIGDVLCKTYAACHWAGRLTAASNCVKITPGSVLGSVIICNTCYHLQNAIVIDASAKPFEVASVTVPPGKALLATGHIKAAYSGNNSIEKTWVKWTERKPEKGESVVAVRCCHPGNQLILLGGAIPETIEYVWKDNLDDIYWIELPGEE